MYIRGPLYGQPKQHTVLADPWLDVVLCCFLLKFFIFEQGVLQFHFVLGPTNYVALIAQLVKKPPAMWEAWVRSLDWEDSLEKGKATHSNILA